MIRWLGTFFVASWVLRFGRRFAVRILLSSPFRAFGSVLFVSIMMIRGNATSLYQSKANIVFIPRSINSRNYVSIVICFIGCIAGIAQANRQLEERFFMRNLLKRDYNPDEFKVPQNVDVNYLAQSILSSYHKSRSVLSCPISTYECGNSDIRSHVPEKSLGKCAVVASGNAILKYEYGSEIDNMDTVFRIGFGPVIKYKEHVGSRTDVMFVRTSQMHFNHSEAIKFDYTGLPLKREHLPERFFLSLAACCQKSVHQGKIILKLKLLSHIRCNEIPYCKISEEGRFASWYKNFAPSKDFEEATSSFIDILKKYRRMKVSKMLKRKYEKIIFTHGFELIISLLHSGLCMHVTTYGFSKFPTYHYFDTSSKHSGRRVRPGHVMGMEYFILEQLQESGLPITLKASD